MNVAPGSAPQRWQQALRKLTGRVPLRIKLITAVLALVAIALVAISVAGISFLRSYLIGQYDGELYSAQQFAVTSVQACLAGGGDACARTEPGLTVDWIPPRGSVQQIVGATDQGMSYRPLPPPNVASAAAWLESHQGHATTVPARSGGYRWRVYALPEGVITPTGAQQGLIVVGVDVTSVYDTLGRLIKIDLIVSGIVLAALAMAGVAIVRSSLRPLTDIERTAQQIASGDLSQRVPDRDPQTEVGRLGSALNTMLTQIETAFHARAESEMSARASEERMRQFVADASHELRTPVTVIRGYAEYYRQRGGADPSTFAAGTGGADPGTFTAVTGGAATQPPGAAPAAGLAGNGAKPDAAGRPGGGPLTRADMDRIIERVEQESTRMGGLVEDMLLLARLDQQRPVERRPVDLLTLAGDAVQDARAIAPDRKIELTVGAGTAFLVLGDEPRLRQVIGNLMSNALTHTPAGTQIDVRIRAGQKAGYPPVPGVTLEVADGGPGMTAEQASHVFERFYRADQARGRRTGGTGLGLAIVSALVAAHGGTVAVNTAPGKGATFRITLPLAPEAQGGEDPGP
jgi:two-component system OmpR family sensor kinase